MLTILILDTCIKFVEYYNCLFTIIVCFRSISGDITHEETFCFINCFVLELQHKTSKPWELLNSEECRTYVLVLHVW